MSSLAVFAERLDYDSQDHAFVLNEKLGESVSRVEARLTALEQQERNRTVSATAVPEEGR